MKTSFLLPGLFIIALASHTVGKTIPNYAAADLVLGQPGFLTGTALPTGAGSLDSPSGVIVDPVSRKVFVTDREDQRVLRYLSADALTNGAPAEAVFGQPRFSSDLEDNPNTELGVDDPSGLFLDRLGRLWVADTDNHRVLMYEAAVSRAGQPLADKVFGQADFITTTSSVGSNKMNRPTGVWVDASDTLWVADRANNRVLRFDTVSNNTDVNSSADAVLGQPNFVTNTPSAGAAGLRFPRSVSVSAAGKLFVADTNNNRVLRYDNAATLANGANATAVLGQLDFVGTTSGLSATQMGNPAGAFITPDDSLWVSENDNSRLIRFDGASTKANGAAANGVLGQPNFTTNVSATTDRGLNGGEYGQPFVDGTGALWFAEYNNNRILRFPADETAPLLVVTTVVPRVTKLKKLTFNGTASDAYGIARVQFKVNAGPLQTAVGTTAWQIKPALKKGRNTITVFATDSVGNVSVSAVLKTKRK
jgi:sugar lactone lactonase YvrE